MANELQRGLIPPEVDVLSLGRRFTRTRQNGFICHSPACVRPLVVSRKCSHCVCVCVHTRRKQERGNGRKQKLTRGIQAGEIGTITKFE